MSQEKRGKEVSQAIHDAMRDDLIKRSTCRCEPFIFYDQEKRSAMLDKIMNQSDMQLNEWEVLNIIKKTANDIQENNSSKYPQKNATAVQINEYVKSFSELSAIYITSKHSNTIIIPMQDVPDSIRDFLNNKELPNIKFLVNESNQLQLHLAVNAPLVFGGQNLEVHRINNLIQATLGLGVLLDFFYISKLKKTFDLQKSRFVKKEQYIDIRFLFSTETENLAEKISIIQGIKCKEAENFYAVLSKILNSSNDAANNISYSLFWYGKSLEDGDIKTKFISLYIGFEALSGIWTKTGKKDKITQDKVKFTISALLAANVTDLKAKQDLLKSIINLRNELFHGNKNEEKIDEFIRKMHKQYLSLWLLYKELFQHTIGKI